MIRIYSFVFNRPDLLLTQFNSFKKNLVNDFEFNVVCDYRDETYANKFEKICEDNKLSFFKHRSYAGSNPSVYHGNCLDWTYNNVILKESTNDDIIFLIDHDMFMRKRFDIKEYMKDCDIAGRLQTRGNTSYIWPGLMLFKIDKVKDINFSFLPCVSLNGEGLDTGGQTYKLLNALTSKVADFKYFKSHDNPELDKYDFELHLDEVFLHSANASNWNNNFLITNDEKNTTLNRLLEDL